jgi:hypothetical protein
VPRVPVFGTRVLVYASLSFSEYGSPDAPPSCLRVGVGGWHRLNRRELPGWPSHSVFEWVGRSSLGFLGLPAS